MKLHRVKPSTDTLAATGSRDAVEWLELCAGSKDELLLLLGMGYGKRAEGDEYRARMRGRQGRGLCTQVQKEED